MPTTNVFAGLRDAKTSERGTFLDPGIYDLKIVRCLVKDTRSSGLAFIVEGEILATSDPVKHPVGSKRTWFQSLKDKDVGFGAIKLFVYAVLGLEPGKDAAAIAEVDAEIESLMDAAISDGKLNGEKVHVDVSMKKTKKGGDFSLHTFAPFRG